MSAIPIKPPSSRRAPSAARTEAIATVAALPMYDLLELRDAHDALWEALRGRLEARGMPSPPALLEREADLSALWGDPGLLLAQTCGYPLVTELQGRVRVLTTPCYAAEGCDGPFHRAVFVVRRTSHFEGLADLRGRRLALNAYDSNTGMNLLRAELAPIAHGERFFLEVTLTGAHAESCVSVAEGRADVASIDAATWALLLRRTASPCRELRVLAWSGRSPGLPLVTSRLRGAVDYNAISGALNDVARSPHLRDVRRELLLEGFQRLSERHYEAVRHLEQLAVSQGYARLH